MNLQSNDRSHEALTVGSLNVLGDLNNGVISSIHTHLQNSNAQQLKLIGDMEKVYKNISADGIISANEKQILKKEVNIIETEYPIILQKAQNAKKSESDVDSFKGAFKALRDYLFVELKIFDEMSEALEVDREIFNKKFADYYKSRAVLQVASDAEAALSFPTDTDILSLLNFDETSQALPAPNPFYTAWQSKIIEYDCTDKQEIKMTFEEALNNVIILSGELKNDFTLKLFFDKQNGNGAKQYHIIYKLTGNYNAVSTTGVKNKNSISQNINPDSYGSSCHIVVDCTGNIWRFKGERAELKNLNITGNVFDDNDFFVIENDNEIKKISKGDGLLAIQKNDSPIGEVKLFYENEYKHGFLEANGLPFSPDVFPEFKDYVKRVWNAGTDEILGWPLRPKLEKADYPIGEVLIAYENEYKHGFLEANGLPFSPDVFPEFKDYVKRVWNAGTDEILGWPLRPVITKDDGTFVFIRACQTAKNDGSHYFIKAIQGV